MKTKRIIQTLTALFLAAGLYAGGAAADEGHRPSKKSGKEKTGMVYTVEQQWNDQFDDRGSLLNLEHGYIP